MANYQVPDCISGQVTQVVYSKWLDRKARSHAKRDRERGLECKVANYKERIHSAVSRTGMQDPYTGDKLDWSLVSKFNNEDAKAVGRGYKRRFALLPTVDHEFDQDGKLSKFVICSWQINDAKNDLSRMEFLDLCEQVLKYRNGRTTNPII